MNDQKRDILAKIKKVKETTNHADAKLAEMAPLYAELNILISEESSSSAAKNERYASWLLVFTILLSIFAIVQICLAVIQLIKDHPN
jgi:hypothetical protein